MRAGNLDRQITLQQVTTVQDAYGEEIETWADLSPDPTVWANVRPVRGRELEGKPGVIAEADTVFKIRHRTDLTRRMRISYNGDLYNIKSINELGRREGLEIFAIAVVT